MRHAARRPPSPATGALPQRAPSLGEELRRLSGLALPVIAGQLGTVLMGTVDTAMVGRVGVDALAAAAVANALIWGVLLASQGMLLGIDPLVAQAHGARDGEAAALALQRACALALCASLPAMAVLWWAGSLLEWAGQPPRIAALAGSYARAQVWSLPFFLLFVALRQYLQGRELMRPAMWVTLVANLFNALANGFLIFGWLGAPALGLVGAGIATGLTRLFMWLALIGLVWRFALHADAWIPWSRRALAPRALGGLAALGAPVAIQMGLEVWAFSAATLLAGSLGALAASAHGIVLNLASLSFMVPLGVSQGAVTRVGNLLGRREHLRARRVAWVALGMGAGLMSISAVAFVTLRHWLPRIYVEDAAVLTLAASILPIAGAFQLFDGTQVVGCGVLRGMGQTRPAAWFNLIGYWVLALPLAWWGTRYAGFGLAGIWWCLCLGLAVVAALLVGWIARAGPPATEAHMEIKNRSKTRG